MTDNPLTAEFERREMFESTEIWGIYDDRDKEWKRNAVDEIIWTFDKDAAKDVAEWSNLDTFDSVKRLPDTIIAQIPEAADALIRLMKITQLRYEMYERPKKERWEK